MTMLDFTLTPGHRPLYLQLYQAVRGKITTGGLGPGTRLPSKRRLSEQLRVSLRTVENAYAQLEVEGYIRGVEKKGYFVRDVGAPARRASRRPGRPPPPAGRRENRREEGACRFDLATGRLMIADFPFSTWARLLRESLRDRTPTLLRPIHPQGNPDLRRDIAAHLQRFRGMDADPESIVLGAGTEYLLGLLGELLPGSLFALEEPTYPKPARILASRRMAFRRIPLDGEGLMVDRLHGSGAGVVLCTPSHHFPLGTVMPVSRRMALLEWAASRPGRYIIEDDYDSEYRYDLRPIPPLHSLDRHGRVVYVNTFTQTLAPSLRIAYMVLPPALLRRYRRDLSFYACTVSEFEQCTMQRFLRGGYYERHLNRIRTACKKRRDALIRGLRPLTGKVAIAGAEAGLHLLLHAAGMGERSLLSRALTQGVRVYGLSEYYGGRKTDSRTVLAGYGGYGEEELEEAARALVAAWS